MIAPTNSRKAGVFLHRSWFLAPLMLACLLLGPLPSLVAQGAAGKTGDEILAMVDKALFLESYTSRIKMETVEPGNSTPKIMEMENQARRANGTYMEVLAPARSKGTRFLQLDGSLWMYNPKTGGGKALRLSARDSFQGSTFSNSDVGKSQYSDEYTATLKGQDHLVRADIDPAQNAQSECWLIESTAKSAESAYSKIVMWVRISDTMPLRMEYYAKSGLLFKRMDLLQIKSFGAFVRPSVMRMESLEKAGTITTITINEMKSANVTITVFNKNYLTR